MNKEDLSLNNQHWLVCHKTKPNQTIPSHQRKKRNKNGKNQSSHLF